MGDMVRFFCETTNQPESNFLNFQNDATKGRKRSSVMPRFTSLGNNR